MKKIFKIMVVTCLTLCMFSMSQVSALDDESDLIERCFNGQTMIIHNGKDVTDVVKEKYPNTTEEELRKIIWEQIKEINKTFPPYKYIKNMILTDQELIKTTTQKIKRQEEIKKILGSTK